MQVELPRFYVEFQRSHILLDGDSLVGAEAADLGLSDRDARGQCG
jgi:hypothetical protein